MADTIVRVYENETRVIVVSGDLVYHYANLAILAADEAEANATISTNERIAIIAAIAGWPSGGGLTVPVASIALLKALTTLSGAVFLYESGRHGTFAWSALNLSAQVTADPNNGIYVAPNSAPTGASGAWVRTEIVGGIAHGSWFGLSANGTTSDAAKINSALALTAVRELRLGAATYALDAQITIPTGKALVGVGRDLTILKRLTYALPIGSPTTVINSVLGTANIAVRDLTINGNRAGNAGVLTDRCNGMVVSSKNFLIERVNIENVTGYAVWNSGATLTPVSGIVRDVECWNFNVGFEQTGATEGIEFLNCHAHVAARDGGAQISYGTEACFHQYDGAGNLRFIDCSADGDTYGFYPLLNSANIDTIQLIGCRFNMTGTGSGLVIENPGAYTLTNFRVVNCRFSGVSPTSNSVASLKSTTGHFANCTFSTSGGVATVGIYTEGSDLHFSGCHVDVFGPIGGGGTVFAVYAATGAVKWDGGTLKVRGPVGLESTAFGAVRISGDTKITRVTTGTTFYWPTNDVSQLNFATLPPSYATRAAAVAAGEPTGRVFRNTTVGALDVAGP